ncbi:GNAT family N-acetyltransferase [Thalassolituus sp. LLYu03]|uniref:GNAT family N-acetyltransferase n=1 Tax=Thalassolituus sp. LLYu03 TaxID=3421656 RepID=UPI003D2E8950
MNKPVSFNTRRLTVSETGQHLSAEERSQLLARVPLILTPAVVEHLPPYFHNITSPEAAAHWLEHMVSEGRLATVQYESQAIIGFLFIHTEKDTAHIGYLLAEPFWGQGLASELLQGFIAHAKQSGQWQTLMGGVDEANTASANVLKKLGFSEIAVNEQRVIFYQYPLNRF